MATRETMTAALYDKGIPENLHDGLLLWVLAAVPPGSFLTAVLENDLAQSMGRADENSKQALPAIMMWLYNDAPMGCSGSPEKVTAWIGYGGIGGDS